MLQPKAAPTSVRGEYGAVLTSPRVRLHFQRDLNVKHPRFKFWLSHSAALRPPVSYVTSVDLSFLPCKMGVMAPSLEMRVWYDIVHEAYGRVHET